MASHLIHSLKCSKKSAIYCGLVLALVVGSWDYMFSAHGNNCQMTYMYQYPEFIPIALDPRIAARFPRYNLYAYGEGGYAQSLSNGVFKGIPVLFVPGNAGHYKQVRSLGSVAHRMSRDNIKATHFNYFSVDFDEDLSGIFGGVIEDQVLFLHHCVEHIANNIYSKYGTNVSVTLIGHSIGGMVARGLFALPTFNANLVDLLITLATPHNKPAIAIDYDMVRFYEDVDRFWSKSRNSTQFSHLTQISIGGGLNDRLVRSDLTLLPTTSGASDLNVVSTSIPDVWVSTDHLAIVWCRQLVIKLNRLLYDLIEENVVRMKQDMAKRMDIIEYHLVSRTRGKFYPNYLIPNNIVFPSIGEWVEVTRRWQRFSKAKVIRPLFFLVKLVPKTTVVITVDGDIKFDWIAACNASTLEKDNVQSRICESGRNLAPFARLLPGNTKEYNKRIFKQGVDALLNQGFSHLTVWLTPTGAPVNLLMERYSSGKRNKAVILPSLPQSLTMLFSHVTILNIPITEESMYYNLSMVGLDQVWHSYTIRLEATACYPTASEVTLVHFHVPWNREDTFTRLKSAKGEEVNPVLMLNSPKPSPGDPRNTLLHLHLDPDCGYLLTLKLSFRKMLEQMARFYSTQLVPWLVAILLSILSEQVYQIQVKHCILVKESKSSLNCNQRPATDFEPGDEGSLALQSLPSLLTKRFIRNSLFGLLPVAPFMASKLCRLFLDDSWSQNAVIGGILSLEMRHLTEIQYLLLHFTLYSFSYSLLYLLSNSLTLLLFLISWLRDYWAKFLSKELNKSSTTLVSTVGVKLKPFFGVLMTMLIAICATSGVGIQICIVFHKIQLILSHYSCYQLRSRRGLCSDTTLWYPHLTILLLLAVLLIPTTPLTIFWFKSGLPLFRFSPFAGMAANSDPHLLPVLFLLISFCFIWQTNPSPPKSFLAAPVSVTLKTLSLLVAIYGNNYSLLPPIVSLALFAYSLLQASSTLNPVIKHFKKD